MFLAGLGLPGALEQEDIGTLLEAQQRWMDEAEESEKRRWRTNVRQTFG